MTSLVPGTTVEVSAGPRGLGGVLVSMGWSLEPGPGPQAEPVPLAIVCGENGKALSPEHVVFFNQPTTASPGIAFSPAEPGRAEAGQFEADFTRIPEDVASIAFVTYIDPEVRGPGTFAPLRDAHVRIARPDGDEIARFEAAPAEAEKTQAMLFGELFRHGDAWAFRALGRAYENGLAGVSRDFGLDV
ncbi:TerD family protein [Sinomonas sp. ASV322]|uniref:TerD family protein n=1 Tax=Sinomonas sp. ASV322 TaxID=3041920 RepID=UPI0027DBFDE9|nr:TerD family protein [Sinomonas sp. ASV322]MDQ4503397.1 TerD family protein [Sinomonas sp. ASV322]